MLQLIDVTKKYPAKRGALARRGEVQVLSGIDLDVREGETHALVGESGSGKSTIAQCVLGFTPVTSGRIVFAGAELTSMGRQGFRRIRRDLQSVFQDPYASLNTRMRVRDIIEEPLVVQDRELDRRQRAARVSEVLAQVHLDEEHLDRYPHELSGGQRQRVCIARALIVRPKLIICDEILSALDVSVQAKIIVLLQEIQRSQGVSYLFITHDFGVVRQLSHRVSVLSKGRIVESGEVDEVLDSPQHDYTRLLLSAVPGQGHDALRETRRRLLNYRRQEAAETVDLN